MQKRKTLTIVPFLNTKLNPVRIESDSKNISDKYYPLYFRVTYARQGTMIKSRFDKSFVSVGDVPKSQLNGEIEILRSIVIFETNGLIDAFDLTKLKTKYDLYSQPVHICLDNYIRGRIKRILGSLENPLSKVIRVGKNSDEYTPRMLFDACKALFPNFETLAGQELTQAIQAFEAFTAIYKPTAKKKIPIVSEWILGKYADEFKAKLQTNGFKVRVINQIVNTIDNIVVQTI